MIFIKKLNIPEAGLITITAVSVNEDMREAKVFLSFYENKIPISQVIDKLQGLKKNIRYQLAKDLKSKYVPKINFFYDNTIVNAEKIANTFKKI